jgi:hypothetical protein
MKGKWKVFLNITIETKTISFNKRLLNPSKLKTSNENFTSTSTFDTKHSQQNIVKNQSSTKVSLSG